LQFNSGPKMLYLDTKIRILSELEAEILIFWRSVLKMTVTEVKGQITLCHQILRCCTKGFGGEIRQRSSYWHAQFNTLIWCIYTCILVEPYCLCSVCVCKFWIASSQTASIQFYSSANEGELYTKLCYTLCAKGLNL